MKNGRVNQENSKSFNSVRQGNLTLASEVPAVQVGFILCLYNGIIKVVVIPVGSSNRIRSSFYISACIHRTSYLRLSIMSKLVVGLMVLKNGYWRHRNHEELNRAVKACS